MATSTKKNKLDKSKLTVQLPPKKNINKTPERDVEAAVRKIHPETAFNGGKTRITLDMPADIYQAVRVHVVTNDLTIKDYFLELARKDLKLK